MRRPVALVILDGWGSAPPGPGNALSLAQLPEWDALRQACPEAQLLTSGEHVGLVPGQAGNSNVGHLNIGAGRIVDQDLMRINKRIASGELFESPVVKKALAAERLHVMTLFSPGGVHAHIEHLKAVLDRLAEDGKRPFLHLFFDGRDVGPKTAGSFLAELTEDQRKNVATVGGRFYAMDRDKRWPRTESAYRAIVEGSGPRYDTPDAALQAAYDRGETDEFVSPAVIGDYQGAQTGDTFFFLNFRADRARQLSHALADDSFEPFERPRGAFPLVAMTNYDEALSGVPVVIEPHQPKDTLGVWLARHGKTQCRIAETEKYAHVTYFFDGGRDEELDGEKRILIPSPKVKTYDLAPEMRSIELAQATEKALVGGEFDVIVVNFAAPDMVGHTGDIPAAVRAVETVDRGIGIVRRGLDAAGGAALFIADHGNVETLIDAETGGPMTAHTNNPVPVVLYGAEGRLKDGILADVAPTLLDLLGVAPPDAMTGASLIVKEGSA